MSASDTRAKTKSKALQIKELYGKNVAVTFKKRSKHDGSFTVWGVVIAPAVGETLAKIRTFKKGNIYLLEPSNVDSIGALMCDPSQIQY